MNIKTQRKALGFLQVLWTDTAVDAGNLYQDSASFTRKSHCDCVCECVCVFVYTNRDEILSLDKEKYDKTL